MVLLNRTHYSAKKWIDSLRVHCRSGRGGHGLPAFGGVGGKGGDVILTCSAYKQSGAKEKGEKSNRGCEADNLSALFRTTFGSDPKNQRLIAENGANSSKQRLIGEAGSSIKLEVPRGVSVIDDESKKLLGELNQPGEELIVAYGGAGGGPTNDWVGVEGQRRFIRLNMKLLSDVGLVGFPNAGKSTLLKAISKANPKIASYPFTTLTPNLGHILYDDLREVSMADLPGLIEGASYNVGLGYRFLKHVERARMLLFVVAIDGFQLNAESVHRSAFETVMLLNRELELYNPDLLSLPAMCVVNKMDLDGSLDIFKELHRALSCADAGQELMQNLSSESQPQKRIQFSRIVPMSAKFSPASVQEVKLQLRQVLDEADPRLVELNSRLDMVKSELSEANRGQHEAV